MPSSNRPRGYRLEMISARISDVLPGFVEYEDLGNNSHLNLITLFVFAMRARDLNRAFG
jgi:hypothetical protein